MGAETLKPGTALAGFVRELRVRHCSKALEAQVRQVLPRFFSHLAQAGAHDLRAVSEAHVVSYLRHLQRRKTRYGRPPSLETQRACLYVVRCFFAFLVRRKSLLLDPAAALRLPKAQSLPRRVLNLTQARRLMTARTPINPRWWAPYVELRDRAIVELLYGTGLRLTECARLQLGDCDLHEGRLLVRNGKGRKDRVVPLPYRAQLATDAYLREARPRFVRSPEPALFVAHTGQALRPITIQVLLRRRARQAGIEGPVSPHVLRHTCATHLLQGGADVRHVQELLGHASLESTVRYTRVMVADLQATIARCHPRERQARYNRSSLRAT